MASPISHTIRIPCSHAGVAGIMSGGTRLWRLCRIRAGSNICSGCRLGKGNSPTPRHTAGIVRPLRDLYLKVGSFDTQVLEAMQERSGAVSALPKKEPYGEHAQPRYIRADKEQEV